MKKWLTWINLLVLTSLLLAACGGIVPVTPGISLTTSDKDGMKMVFVPQGKFTMGSDFLDNEKPIHKVTLDAYWIDQTEVTNAMYAKCVSDGVCKEIVNKYSSTHSIYYGNSEFNNYPVIHVNWDMAKTYCTWRGDKLPTEAQWEKAARGTDARIYPWGNNAPTADLLNFNQNVGDTTQVGKYPSGASPYGLYDLAGNVWEWVADWYSDVYYQNSPSLNPLGPDTGKSRVLRGSSWYHYESNGRSTYRRWSDPANINFNVGFRCVRSLP